MKNMFCAAVSTVIVLLTFSLFGSVFDDAIWMMQPEDRNSDGFIDSGETVNWLKGGDLNDNTHKCYVYGYNDNHKMEQVTINSRFLSGYTTTAMLITDANTSVGDDGTTTYFPGAVVMNQAVPNLIDVNANSFSAIVRCCPQDANSNTRWALRCGSNSKRGFEIGFVGNHVRVYSGGDKGNVASGKSYIGALPVNANEWVDLGITVSWKPELVDGEMVTTGRLHVVVAKVGSDSLLTDDSFANKNMIPDTSAVKIGVETEVEKATTTKPDAKRFKGHIHQVALWNRALTDDEFIEAFKFAAPTHSLVGRNDGTANEFTEKTATSVNLDAAWHEIPKTLSSGTTWSMSFTPSETSARCLTVKSAAGATTLAVRDKDGNELDSASIAEGGEIQLFLPRDATKYGQTGGQLQFRLANTGSAALTLDSMALTEGALKPIRVTHNDDVTVSTPIDVEQDTMLEIYVAEGKTAVYSGVISGVGAVHKTGPGTLQVTAANTISGGFTVDEGYLKGTPGDGTTVFGPATVTVNATGDKPAQAIIAGTFANTFAFTGTSSDDYPALHFADETKLNGSTEKVNGTNAAIRAEHATVYMTTAWDDTTAYAETKAVEIKNATFAQGGTIALAPHCMVSFGGRIYCDLLDLYWRANSSAADGGNPGIVLLPGWGDRISTGACGMKRVRIDQTRIRLAANNPFGGGDGTGYTFAIVEWTGEHKTGGSIDMNTAKCCLGQVITPPTTPDDETSMRIIQSGSGWLNFYNTPTSTLYLRLEGSMPCSCNTPNSTITFKDRRHLFTNRIIGAASKVVITGGTKFLLPCEMNFNGSNSDFTFTGLTDPDALKHVTTYSSSRNRTFKFDAQSFATVANDYTVTFTQSSGCTYDLPTDSVWRLKSVTANGSAVDAGEYHMGGISGVTLKNEATLLVATTGGEAIERDPVHWNGEKWVDANDQEPTEPLYLAHRAATCETDGASATLPCDAFFSSLLLNKTGEGVFTLSGAEGVSLNISGALNLSGGADYTIQPHTIVGGPIIIDGGKTLTFENDVIFNDTVLVSNKALVVSGEVSGSGKIVLATGTESELRLDGAEIRVPVDLGNISSLGSFRLTATGSTLTNVFHGKLTDAGSTYVYLTDGYTYLFDGGFKVAGKHTFRVNGNDDSKGATIILTGSGNTIDWRPGDGWFNCENANHMILDFANAGGRYVEAESANSVIEFRQDDFFPLSYAQTLDRAAMHVNGTFLLNDTHQYANYLRGSGVIAGAEGAEMEIALGTNYTFKGSFTGAVGLTMNGVTQAISGVSTSTGAITVKKGILNFIENAEWENAREVNVEGGRLALDVKKPFGADTQFNVQPGGTVQLDKRVSVAQASYDGEKLPDGVYGAEGSGAEHEVGWISGTGRLRVGTLGLVILVR